MVRQDTGKNRKNIKDQFYTHPDVSKHCINTLLSKFADLSTYIWVEPSAGNGSFLNQIPDNYEKIGMDIEPHAIDIQKEDFLTWKPPTTTKKFLLIGNPPFGRQSSLAKGFIKKGCKFANVIAFILPKSFVKPSMNYVFDIYFHCIHTEDIQKNAFTINDSVYDVPCVFQIWEKKNIKREIESKVEPVGYKYVKKENEYHIAVRRVGVHAGKCYLKDEKDCSIQSHYFIQFEENCLEHLQIIMIKINNYVFPSNTVGPRSLSKTEVNRVINQILEEFS